MKSILAVILAAVLAAVPTAAQPTPVECPLPPYQLPLLPPERSFIDEQGQLFVSGVEAPVELPDGLQARQHQWSDDGEVMLVTALAPDYSDSRVFAYRDGGLTEVLSYDELFGLRDEVFRDAVGLFDFEFIPGTHTVLFNSEVLALDPGGIHVEHPLDLWSLDLDSGELTEIYPYDEGGQFHIAPGGSTLVLMNYDRIWQADLDGTNERTIHEGVVGMGLGHGYSHPPLVWDNEADIPTFRALLFPSYDPNGGEFGVPFEIHEYVLGEEITSSIVNSGPSNFFPTVEMSPDGYSAAQWWWTDENEGADFEVTVFVPGEAPRLLDTVDRPSNGDVFLRWDDATHLSYGYLQTDPNGDGLVTSWRADLCGEIVELEPYQAAVPGLP